MKKKKQIPEAAFQRLVSSFEETTQAIVKNMATVQERNLEMVQRQFLDWIEAIKEQSQVAQSLAQGLEEQDQKQQEVFYSLAHDAVESYFDMLQAALPYYPPSLRLTEKVQICLLALASRYPHHLVDINEAVLGHQGLGAEGWRAEDLIEWLQHTAPQLLQAKACLEVTSQRKGIYLLERSEAIPAFWVHCGEAGEKMPPFRGNMTARQAEQRRRRKKAAGPTAVGEEQMMVR